MVKTQEQLDQEKADEEYARRLQERYDRRGREQYRRRKVPQSYQSDAFTSYIHFNGVVGDTNQHARESYRNTGSARTPPPQTRRIPPRFPQSSGHVLDEEEVRGPNFAQMFGQMVFYPTLSASSSTTSFPTRQRSIEERIARSNILRGNRDFDENDYETLLKLEDVKVGLDDRILRLFPCYVYKGRHSTSPSVEDHQEVICLDDDDDDDDNDNNHVTYGVEKEPNGQEGKPSSKKGKLDEMDGEKDKSCHEGEKEGDDDAVEVCPVCLENIVPGELVRRLPCLDLYHKDCIDKWLKENTKCPVCRLDCRNFN